MTSLWAWGGHCRMMYDDVDGVDVLYCSRWCRCLVLQSMVSMSCTAGRCWCLVMWAASRWRIKVLVQASIEATCRHGYLYSTCTGGRAACLVPRCSCLDNWVLLSGVPKSPQIRHTWDFFSSDFKTFWLVEQNFLVKVYWNQIWKSPRFVPDLTDFGAKSDNTS